MKIKSLVLFLYVLFCSTLAAEAKIITSEDLMRAYLEKDHKKVIEYAKIIANGANDPFAQTILGEYYYWGKGGLTKDYSEAYKWFKLASDQDVKSAHNYIGTMYEEGQGLPKDCRKAIEYYIKASGHFTGQYSLGIIYKNGSCVEKDTAKAIYWFKQAAEQSYPPAIDQLLGLKVISMEEAQRLMKKNDIGCYFKDETAKRKSEEMYNQGVRLIQNGGNIHEASDLIEESALMGNPKALLFNCIAKTDPMGMPSYWKEGCAWCQIADELTPKSFRFERKKLREVLKQLESQLSEKDRTEASKIKEEIQEIMPCK